MVISVTLLSVAGLLATAAMLAVGLPLVARNGRSGASVRYGIVAGTAEVGAATMYLVWWNVGGAVAFATANTLAVLGAAMLPAAFHALQPTRVSRWCMIVAAACPIAVAITSLTLSESLGVAARVGALAVVCACAAVAALTSSHAERAPVRVLAAAVGSYAVYSAMRLVALVAGAEQAEVFSDAGAILLAIVVVLAVGASAVWFWITLRLDARRAPGGTSCARVTIVDGRWPHLADVLPRFPELLVELRDAAAAVDARAVAIDDGVALADPGSLPLLLDHLRDEYQWTEEELALVSASSST